MPVTGRRLVQVLLQKGWKVQRISGSHHILAYPGRPGILSVPVHANQDLKPGTQRAIMRQAGLTNGDL